MLNPLVMRGSLLKSSLSSDLVEFHHVLLALAFPSSCVPGPCVPDHREHTGAFPVLALPVFVSWPVRSFWLGGTAVKYHSFVTNRLTVFYTSLFESNLFKGKVAEGP